MIGYIENVKIISSFHMQSKPYGKIDGRKTHGFIYRIKGSADYTINGSYIRVNEGEMIFLPKCSSYEYRTIEGTDNLYTSINFEAEITDMEITVYSLKDFPGAGYMLEGFSGAWRLGSSAEKYKCLSGFYDLLSYISHLDHLGRLEKENYRIISPAVEYLKAHIYDMDFKVESLHFLCGISDTYFRRLFKSVFALTPQEYMLKERLTQAKLMIEGADYDSIKAVAEAVGYSDPLYFSKAFRKRYGIPPSNIVKSLSE